MSHRIIEKRRRDRMNNCLADLSRLIPPDYLKKGRGRVEKTEIIEMAIRHLKFLQDRSDALEHVENGQISAEHFYLGYQECLSEVLRYLVEIQGHFPTDTMCEQIVNHLQCHCTKVMKGDVPKKPRSNPDSNSSSSGSLSNYICRSQGSIHHNGLRKKGKSTENNPSDMDRLKNSKYAHHTIESDYNSLRDLNQTAILEGMDDGTDITVNNRQNSYSQQKTSPLRNNIGNGGLKIADNNVDEGGGSVRMSLIQKGILEDCNNLDGDCLMVEDLHLSALYPGMSPPRLLRRPDMSLRNIRKTESQLDSGLSSSSALVDAEIHSYKFKNTIKQRFSQSQSTDYRSSSPSEGAMNINSFTSSNHLSSRRDQFVNGKISHKRRKTNIEHHIRHGIKAYEQISSSETNSSENIPSISQNSIFMNKQHETDNKNFLNSDNKNNLKLENSSPSKYFVKTCDLPMKLNENFASKMSGVGVPIFALHAKGSFYIPMNVDYDSLIPFLGPHDLLDATSVEPSMALHPVTISVNFQPMLYKNK